MAIYVWEKVKDYLTKAGTTIFVASIAMWILLNFGPHGYTTEMVDSFGAVLGHWLVPFFEPIGLGYWQIAVALIAGISAKEVVVSSCAVLFGIPNITSEAGMNTLVGIRAVKCILLDDFLPALYTMCSGNGNNQERSKKLEVDVFFSSISACCCMGNDFYYLSYWEDCIV